MKLDFNSQVYINCRTQEERDMIADILRILDCKWTTGRRLDSLRIYDAPVHIELDRLNIRHGRNMAVYGNTPRPYTIVEAIDFRNQWVSMHKSLDKQ